MVTRTAGAAGRKDRALRLALVALLAAWLGAGAPGASAGQPAAEAILEATGVRGGLAVHLGCGDGGLAAALGAGGGFLVHGLDADAANIAAARGRIQSAGLYGKVSVERLVGNRLPYADNLVNLLVAEGLGGVPMAEVMRILAPNGVAYIRSGADWVKTVKPRPADIDDWTHWLHDASGNAVAHDRVVGPPRHVQWIDGPVWARHHELNTSIPALVSAGGRVFYLCDEAPATAAGLPDRWALLARDAFNGVLLWRRPIEDWGWKAWSPQEAGGRFNLPIYIARRLVAAGDRVYVTAGFNAPLVALDAATGRTVRTYDGTQFTDEVTYRDGLLVLSVNRAAQKPGLISEAPPVTKQVVALRADTGEVLWRQGDYVGVADKADSFERITHLSLSVGREHVFLVEPDAVVGLDLKTGRERWRWRRPEKKGNRGHIPYNPPELCTLVATDEVVLFAQPEEPYTKSTWNRGVKVLLTGLSAATGKTLWTQPCSKWGPGVEADVFVVDGLVWTHDDDARALLGIDLRTGQVKRTFSTEEAFKEAHHHRCYRNKATDRYLLTARRGIEFLDLQEEQCQKNHWVRGSCRYGVVPCNGLVYAPPHACQCYIAFKLSGFYALAAGRADALPPREAAKAERLEKGPAYAAAEPQPALRGPQSDGWPTYRHDAARSGSTGSAVPTALRPLWRAELGGPLTACTVGGGMVFTAQTDRHRICALDEKDGRLVWSFTAGGRVDTPPTLHADLVLFGSADGWVYGLRASDGAMAWRFRAAPEDRRIVAFGQLESPWPVHGTVLAMDDVAYVAAGRSTYLDGGFKLHALKCRTGELIGELSPSGQADEGLEDVLVSDGSAVYMRHLKFDLQAAGPDLSKAPGKSAPGAPRAFSTAGLLDDSYFSRVGWSTADKGGKGKKAGQADLLVFDERATYAFGSRRKGGFGGWFTPGTGAYELSAFDRQAGKERWSQTMPIRIRAMVAAGQTLFIAGPADAVEPADPWAVFEGRKGALLRAVAAADGAKLAEYALEAPPVFDGMAAAGGRLYLATLDGKVVCWGGK